MATITRVSSVDLSLLRTCLIVYRTGSLTKAARVLGVSQPAVTGQLRALEEKLQQQLFVRMQQGTVPTQAACELVQDTGEALDNIETALRRRLEPEKLADRTVRLAGPADVITIRVLPSVTDLIADGLRLQISFGHTDDLLAGLTEGMYDLVIATSRPRHMAIQSIPLMDEEFALVGAEEWAQRLSAEELKEYNPRALCNVPIISYANNLPIIRHYWLTVFGHHPTFAAQVTVPDLRAVLAAVLAGAGISVLPTYLCADEIDSGKLAVLCGTDLPPLNTLYLATRADGLVSVGLTTLRSHLLVKARLWR
jgi:DNA-binding transcriptional LysR family regulator